MIRAILLSVAMGLTGCAAWAPPRTGERISRNLVFASPSDRDLRMDLYVPKSPKPAPAVIWIFGGSWRIGSKGYHVNLRDLPRHGIALVSIEYRLSSEAKYPAQLEDCRAALQWLRIHGAAYGIDPQRIGVAGESAGGHLAALLGTTESAHIDGVAVLYPPAELISLGRQYSNPRRLSDIERLLGGPIEQKLALAAAASPVSHVDQASPPFLIIHGARDKLVPLSQSQLLMHRLQVANVPARLIVVPDRGHWFKLNENQVSEVVRFFKAAFVRPSRRE